MVPSNLAIPTTIISKDFFFVLLVSSHVLPVAREGLWRWRMSLRGYMCTRSIMAAVSRIVHGRSVLAIVPFGLRPRSRRTLAQGIWILHRYRYPLSKHATAGARQFKLTPRRSLLDNAKVPNVHRRCMHVGDITQLR